MRADPPPPETTRGAHFLVSNEDEPYVWPDVVDGRGGMQIGVGAEQNFLLAGWSRPAALVCLDFDQWVVDLNWVHGLVFEKAAGPEELLELWTKAGETRMRRWIAERWPDDHQRKLELYLDARYTVYKRLLKVRGILAARDTQSILTAQDQFDHVAKLWRSGRALSIRGDLTAKKAMQDVARVARDHHVPVRVLYLSNTEWYFEYDTASYTPNILALPFDERSVVLHTRPIDDKRFNYVHQAGLTYQAWLRSGKVKVFGDLFEMSETHGDRYKQLLHEIAKKPPS